MTARPDACPEWLDLIHDVVYGPASAEDVALFEAHVTNCKGCATVRRALRDLHRALRAVEPVDPPDDVDIAGDVAAQLEAEARALRGSAWRGVAAGVSAAAAGALLLADPAGLATAWAGVVGRVDALLPVAETPLPAVPDAVAAPVSATFDGARTFVATGAAGARDLITSVPGLAVAGVAALLIGLNLVVARRVRHDG